MNVSYSERLHKGLVGAETHHVYSVCWGCERCG